MAEAEAPTQLPDDGSTEAADDSELDAKMKQFNLEGSQKMDSKLSELRSEATSHLDLTIGERMASSTKSYESQITKNVSSRQNEILQMNKIFRDVGRVLGEKWRSVFASLTSELPEQVVAMELSKIELQRPFMQPYKSLTSWKELMRDEFQMAALVKVLEQHDLSDLAKSVQDTMGLDTTTIMAQKDASTGIASGRQVRDKPTDGDESETDQPQPSEATRTMAEVNAQARVSGALDDRNLLKIAKAIGGSWMDFARALHFPDDEIQAILKSDGMSYQSVFKILWTWRDRVEDNVTQDNKAVLQEALRKSGRSDLADTLGQ